MIYHYASSRSLVTVSCMPLIYAAVVTMLPFRPERRVIEGVILFLLALIISSIANNRDAKSPVSGGRLPYLDVYYGLPYGRTYLPFSTFTYGMSGDDRHTHAGEAAVVLLDCHAHHCVQR